VFNLRVPSVYRFSRALLVQSLGILLVALGLLLVLVAALVLVAGLPGAVLTVAVVLAVLVLLGGGLWVARGGTLVRLEEDGYQVRLLRGAGVRRARWRDVEDLVTARVSGHDCVVLRLKDGRTTTIPVQVLDADGAAFVKDLTAHLDRGHGYRRLS
jgi:hypothetical protein